MAIAWITFTLSGLRGVGLGLPWVDSLLFGSLMSSIDPIATLGILTSVGVNQGDTLYTLIFGECMYNTSNGHSRALTSSKMSFLSNVMWSLLVSQPC
jgi:hypothetical protein